MGLAACKVVRCMQQELSADPGDCLAMTLRRAFVEIKKDVEALSTGDKQSQVSYESIIAVGEQPQISLQQQVWMRDTLEWMAGMRKWPGAAPR